MKIIKIQFTGTEKVYSYLLNAGTAVFPKVNDIIHRVDGCRRRYGYYSTKAKVIQIEEVRRLPEYVTSAITVLNNKLEYNDFKLTDPVKRSLQRGEKDIALMSPQEKARKTREEFFKMAREILADLFKEED